MVAEAQPQLGTWVGSQEENRQKMGHDCEITVIRFLQ